MQDGSLESPAQQANAFAAAAEMYTSQGQLAKAHEAHFRAAELYLLAMNDTTDLEAVKTLKLLYANHTRSGKELQRRVNQQQQHQQSHQQQTPAPASGAHLPSQHQQQQQQQPVVSSNSYGSPKQASSSSTSKQPSHKQSQGAIHLYSTQAQTTQATLPVSAAHADASSLMLGSRQYFVGQTQADSAVLATQHPATLPRAKSRHSDDYSGISTSDRQQLAEPATVPVKSLDQSDMSSQSIGQSYLLLDENAKEIRRGDELDDPFNRFWEAVEGLVQKISVSAPVAFATVPLVGEQQQQQQQQQHRLQQHAAQQSHIKSKSFSGTSDPSSTDPRLADMTSDSSHANAIMQSYMMVPSDVPSAEQAGGTTGLLSRIPLQRTASMVDRARREIGAGTSTSPLGGNSGLGQLPKVPEDGKRAASRKTLEEYQIENNHFRQIIDKLTQRLVTLEKTAEENNMLKSSIIQFHQDVRQQAAARRFIHGNTGGGSLHPAMATAAVSSSWQLPPSGAGASRSYTPSSQAVGSIPVQTSDQSQVSSPGSPVDAATLIKRVAMLEAQLKELQEQLEEKDAVIEKYRERWDKLKESAKKKKEAKSLAGEPLNSNDTAPAAATTAGNLLSDRLAQARSLDLPPLPHEAGISSGTSPTARSSGALRTLPQASSSTSSSMASSPRNHLLSRPHLLAESMETGGGDAAYGGGVGSATGPSSGNLRAYGSSPPAAPSLSSTITNRLDATSSRPPLAAAMSSSIAPSLYHSTLSRYDDIFDNDDNSL